MSQSIPRPILVMLELADTSWRDTLLAGLRALSQQDPGYLPELIKSDYLPNNGRLFAAFAQPMEAVRYVLVGEGPYPRAESATGFCFMDGAVGALWSENGLSKQVNRATSLRNYMKMLLVADGSLSIEATGGAAVAQIAQQARAADSDFIQTLAELQGNLLQHGFLLLNATLVYRPEVPPLKDAKAWRPFLQEVLAALADRADLRKAAPPTLIVWGKVAELLSALPANARFPKAVAEHPYNLSFIGNAGMQGLFGPLNLLKKSSK